MFTAFFYKLREVGIPVSPTAFLTFQKALSRGLIRSVADFYVAARALLVKSERYFDLYDRVFAHYFEDAEMPDPEDVVLDDAIRLLLDEWLRNPEELAAAMGLDESEAARMTPDELIEYFKARLKDQDGRHEGGNRWIGTGGTSPVGHSGHHPGGMRVGGISRNKSAVKVALDRRYRDYSHQGVLTRPMIGEALKRLRHMIPTGPRDQVNVDETIYRTMKNAGEIEIVFDRSLRDRLKVLLVVDNGGWSMDPYIPVVQTLFDHARAQFKDVKTFFFHNTIYDQVWADPARVNRAMKTEAFARFDPATRLILVGDASMAPYELMAADGSIHITDRSRIPSIERLRFLASTFSHCAWLNPVTGNLWGYTPTIRMIKDIFPMFELTLDGLEKAVQHLMAA